MATSPKALKGVKINFNLRNRKTPSKPTLINCVIRYNNLPPIVISGVEKIEPRYWNSEKQVARASQRNAKGEYINDILSETENALVGIFDEYKKKYKAYPDRDHYKDLCLKALNKENPQEEERVSDLLSFAELFIKETETGKRLNHATGKPLSPAIITVYKTVKNTLAEFKQLRKYSLQFDNITLEFYEDFTDYLKFDKRFSTNTIGKYIKTIKTMFSDAKERGFTNVEHFKSKRFKVVTEETDSIYLNSQELERMFKLDLTNDPRLERVRDLFLVGCWTGLRFSDYNDISPKSVIGDYLKVKITKTGKEVVIPIHHTVRAIMSRYEGKTDNSLPPSISNPKMNEYIKEVAQLAELNEIIETKFTKAGKLVYRNDPKYKRVGTHTARRSFATNMYLMGVPTITIMAITDHKTESSFMKYIKVTPSEHATNMLSIWRQQNLKIVNG